MSDIPVWQLVLGFLGQACFGASMVIQWLASERQGRPVVPVLFWRLRAVAACCILAYVLAREDIIFVVGTLPGAIIAIRSMMMRRGLEHRIVVPLVLIGVCLAGLAAWSHPRVATGRIWWWVGGLGSLLWTTRWLVQWWASERAGHARLPVSFFAISLLGSVLLLAYAISVPDPVMMVALALAPVPYARNIILFRRSRR